MLTTNQKEFESMFNSKIIFITNGKKSNNYNIYLSSPPKLTNARAQIH